LGSIFEITFSYKENGIIVTDSIKFQPESNGSNGLFINHSYTIERKFLQNIEYGKPVKFVDHSLYGYVHIPVELFLFAITKNQDQKIFDLVQSILFVNTQTSQILDNKDFKIESLNVYEFVKETYYKN